MKWKDSALYKRAILAAKFIRYTDEELEKVSNEELYAYEDAGMCFAYCSPEEIREWARYALQEGKAAGIIRRKALAEKILVSNDEELEEIYKDEQEHGVVFMTHSYELMRDWAAEELTNPVVQ
jgi:hypothetical protein